MLALTPILRIGDGNGVLSDWALVALLAAVGLGYGWMMGKLYGREGPVPPSDGGRRLPRFGPRPLDPRTGNRSAVTFRAGR